MLQGKFILLMFKKHKKLAKKIKITKKEFAGIVLVLLLGFSFIFNVVADAASGYVWAYEEQRFAQKLNSYRSSKGKGSLVRSKCLTDAARSWSKTMATRNSLEHSDYDLVSTFCGVSASSGENILYTAFGSAEQVLSIWKNSSAHNSIMLGGSYDYMGVGIFFDTAHEKTWATGLFLDCNSGCPSAVTSSPNDYFGSDSNKCAYVSINSSKIYTGAKFTADIAFLNNGGSVWFPSTHGAYWAGSGSSKWGKSKVSLGTSGVYFNPGLEGWHSGTFTAPTQAGTYDFKWRMKNSSGFFGSTCSKSITVYSNGSTSSNSTGTTGTTSTGGETGDGEESSNSNADSNEDKESSTQPEDVTLVKKLALNDTSLGEDIPELESDAPIKLSGYSRPNSKLKIYIFSDPHEAIVATDKNGYWEYEAESLEPGDHHIEIALLDKKTGKEIKRETIAKFIILAQTAHPSNKSPANTVGEALDMTSQSPKILLAIAGAILVSAVITSKFWWHRLKKKK